MRFWISFFVSETHIILSYTNDGQGHHQRRIDAKHVANSSFVRWDVLTGTNSLPNTFFLHVDDVFAVIYRCQTRFILFHKSDVIVLSRMPETSVKEFYPKLVSVMTQNGFQQFLKRIHQPLSCFRFSQNRIEAN